MPLPNDCLGVKDTLVEEETSAVGAVGNLLCPPCISNESVALELSICQ